MPIYQYECSVCGHIADVLLTRIPKTKEEWAEVELGEICCETPMKRIMSQNTFHLKGECWCKDGYHRTGKVHS